jgi:hypothetical protein
MSMQPSPRNVKYEEEVRVQWGFGPKRAGPDSSRNRGRLRVWRTYKVEMEHSADRGYFRVKFQPSDAHCIEYCRDELDDEGEEPMPDSWFDSTCECGLVHDGSGHDTEESEGAGSVYNVQPSRQREAQLPPQLPPQLPRRLSTLTLTPTPTPTPTPDVDADAAPPLPAVATAAAGINPHLYLATALP